MRRITVDEVKAAYEKTGLTPRRGKCDDGAGGACAIGALHVASETPNHNPYRWAELTFGEGYCRDFVYGFDGSFVRSSQGYEDGRAAAAAIFAEATP